MAREGPGVTKKIKISLPDGLAVEAQMSARFGMVAGHPEGLT